MRKEGRPSERTGREDTQKREEEMTQKDRPKSVRRQSKVYEDRVIYGHRNPECSVERVKTETR